MDIISRFTPAGPKVTVAEATQVVSNLRWAAQEAVLYVSQTTQLPEASGPVSVLTRPGLVRANVALAKRLIHPDVKHVGPMVAPFFAFLSQRIMGQYDPTVDQLYLNAPTILEMERKLKVDPADFRLWVCIHEQTHRSQFYAAPWLKEELASITYRLTDPNQKPRRRDRKAMMNRATGIMSLLEGHAELIMDMVGLESTKKIRSRVNEVRQQRDLFSLVGKLLGLDRKMAQYFEGRVFCEAVLAEGGMELLNKVFSTPEAMPTIKEIRKPKRWIKRMA